MHGHPDTIIDELDHEWQRLRTSGVLNRSLAEWRGADERLADFQSVLELFDLLKDPRASRHEKSEVLLALLTIGQRDRLASRVVLQRFLPALKRMAAWDQPFTVSDWASHVVAEAFEVIATYPIEQRPAKVAANIVMDVRKRLYALLTEHQVSQGQLGYEPFTGTATMPDPADRVEAAQLIEWGRRQTELQSDVAELIVSTRILGFTVKELARRLGVPSARLRKRISRSEQRFREVLPAI